MESSPWNLSELIAHHLGRNSLRSNEIPQLLLKVKSVTRTRMPKILNSPEIVVEIKTKYMSLLGKAKWVVRTERPKYPNHLNKLMKHWICETCSGKKGSAVLKLGPYFIIPKYLNSGWIVKSSSNRTPQNREDQAVKSLPRHRKESRQDSEVTPTHLEQSGDSWCPSSRNKVWQFVVNYQVLALLDWLRCEHEQDANKMRTRTRYERDTDTKRNQSHTTSRLKQQLEVAHETPGLNRPII